MDNHPLKTAVDVTKFKMPEDTNMEETCMTRNEYKTVYGILVEIVFQKQVVNSDHLAPKLMWTILEGVKVLMNVWTRN